MKLHSDFCLLDVKRGKLTLEKELKKRGYPKPHPKAGKPFIDGSRGVPVTIHGVITEPWGNDDGVSMEFSVTVKKVTVK